MTHFSFILAERISFWSPWSLNLHQVMWALRRFLLPGIKLNMKIEKSNIIIILKPPPPMCEAGQLSGAERWEKSTQTHTGVHSTDYCKINTVALSAPALYLSFLLPVMHNSHACSRRSEDIWTVKALLQPNCILRMSERRAEVWNLCWSPTETRQIQSSQTECKRCLMYLA